MNEDSVPTPKKRRSKRQAVLTLALILIIVGLGATSVFFYRQYQDLKNNPQAATQESVQVLTQKAGRLIKLPDETPTVAVVQDKESLKDQPFFNDAQNGDKVLIFAKAKQAIIYRESEDKLINVGPVSLDSNAAGVATPAPAE